MKPRLTLILSMLWALLILALGSWWLYLITTFGERIQYLERKLGPQVKTGSVVEMVKWEGLTFFVLLILLSGTLFFLYLKDQKKTKALQAFFASLTHELKTPLASIKLQSEVLNETVEGLIEDDSKRARLTRLTSRLTEDSLKLENQMDKILQLSRIERGGNLNPTPVNLIEFIKQVHQKWGGQLELSLEKDSQTGSTSPQVLADEFALELIFRNLFENTRTHTHSDHVRIDIEDRGPWIDVTYSDEGEFEGETEHLSKLFYKHDSSKGSGIGLYLVKTLMEKMGGVARVHKRKGLSFELILKKEETQ